MLIRPIALWVIPMLFALLHPEDPLQEQEVAKIGKVITWLIAIMTAELVVAAFVFRFLVATEITQLKLELAHDYAVKAETLSKTEYELRHAELIQQDKQLSERIGATERRLDAQGDRLIALERKH